MSQFSGNIAEVRAGGTKLAEFRVEQLALELFCLSQEAGLDAEVVFFG